jgi:hypothetical protein
VRGENARLCPTAAAPFFEHHATFGDHFGAVGSTALKAALQFVDRRGQNEHPHHVLLVFLIKLLGALPIDIEQEVLPLLQGRADDPLWRAISVAEHFGPFVEIILFDHRIEAFRRDKVVVHAVNFAGTGRAGGGGYRKLDLWVLGQQHPRQRGFARARRRGEDEHQPTAVELVCQIM